MTTITDGDTLDAALAAATWTDRAGRPQGTTVELPPGKEVALTRQALLNRAGSAEVAACQVSSTVSLFTRGAFQ